MGKVKKDKVAAEVRSKSPSPKKKKSEKRGSGDWSRKYAVIYPQSVKLAAETVGITGLSDEVASTLSEEVSYRLRSVIQLCSKYMKHSRRKRLRCSDVNEVFQMCDIPVVLGHSSPGAPTEFTAVPEAGIVVLDDPLIDLFSYAVEDVLVSVRSASAVIASWVPAEDQRSKLKVEDSKGVDTTDGRPGGSQSIKTEGDARPVEVNKALDLADELKLPTNLIKYYGITCNTILGYSDLKKVYQDLSRNEKILPIVPFMLNFITISLSKLGSERQIERLLHTVEALTENTRIDFRPYYPVTRLMNTLLKMITMVMVERKRDLTGQGPPHGQKVQFSYSYPIRIRSAQVLARVVRRWGCTADDRTRIITDMGKLLSNWGLPPRVHVGAVALLKEMGPAALRSVFWAKLPSFLSHMQSVRQDKDALELIILEAAQVLYRNPHGPEPDCPSAQELDRILYEHFGDAICPFRLHLLENPKFVSSFVRPTAPASEYKAPDTILKGTWKLPRCLNSMYNPDSKRLTVESAFELGKTSRKRYPRISFTFAGANPLPEMSLKRRRLDSRYSQFIAGSVCEGHVVLVGKFWKRPKIPPSASVISTPLFLVL